MLEEAQLSPEIYKLTEHISSIFQDESLHQDSPTFSYSTESTNRPQSTLVYSGTDHISEKSKDKQDTSDNIQSVLPTNQRRELLSSQLSDEVGWNSTTSDATPTKLLNMQHQDIIHQSLDEPPILI